MKDFFAKLFDREVTKEERFGLGISVAAHLLLILIAWLIYNPAPEQDRIALMEVTLGEFAQGAPVSRAPDPVPEPVREQPAPPPRPQPTPPAEVTRPVELPEQTQPVISEDVVVTPPATEVEPEIVPPPEPEPEPQPEPEPEPQPEPEPEPEPVTTPQPEPRPRAGSLITGQPDPRNQDSQQEGTARDQDRSAPYILDWEGDISRQPQVNPLPNYTVDVEAVITVRFAVRPDGTVATVTPLRRTDPQLESEVIRTVRNWRFNRLPSGVPQEVQHGTVTFRFVLD
ncbi:MAG: TonB family protein [Candidatus Cyclonatronum sp.]|uniref:TonB family protein n=1 Tax=Cyclonatronum sp. TaxID=3024185 RepID=UPI0025BF9CEA|nr:TonB family protein [Cyclonatronum sp.]MCH8487181.1 TonB family protein [Cyclonatronum sp.]